ncbi:MAG TPA: hypothetical protein ENI77_12150 [Nitrospirae bacterium]|nr:hypothetical protein [Nitrospirota bacterium]
MSELSKMNVEYRVDAIRAALKHHPSLLKRLLNDNQDGINLNATVEALDCDEPEDILVRVAWDIWNGSGETEFDKILHQLMPDDYEAVLNSMKKFGKLRERIYSAYASGSEND